MNFIADRKQLVGILEDAYEVSKHNTDHPVILLEQAPGRLTAHGRSQTLSIQTAIELPGPELTGSAILTGKAVEFCKLGVADTVEVRRGEKATRLKCGRATLDLDVYHIDQYPQMPPPSRELCTVVTMPAPALLAAIKRAEVAVGKDGKFLFSNVLIDITPEDTHFVGLDGSVLTAGRVPAGGAARWALIQESAADLVRGSMAEGDITLIVGGVAVWFESAYTTVCARQVEGRRPPWRGAIEVNAPQHRCMAPAKLLKQAVAQAALGIDTNPKSLESGGVVLRFSANELTIRSRSEGRSAQCELPLACDFAHEIELPHKPLIDILSQCGDEVEIGVGSTAGGMVLSSGCLTAVISEIKKEASDGRI